MAGGGRLDAAGGITRQLRTGRAYWARLAWQAHWAGAPGEAQRSGSLMRGCYRSLELPRDLLLAAPNILNERPMGQHQRKCRVRSITRCAEICMN